MGKTKTERRSEILKEKFHEYLEPIVEEKYDPFKGLTKAAIGGIIKDRISFYIQENYGGNVNFYRFFHAPTNFTIDCFNQFLEDEVDYSDIKEFYFRNEGKFKKDTKDVDPDPEKEYQNVVIIFSKSKRGFINSSDSGVVTFGREEQATKFDKFMNVSLTKMVINKSVLLEDHYENGESIEDDLILIHPKRPELYPYSETLYDEG